MKSRIAQALNLHVLLKVLSLLSSSDKKKLLTITVIQAALGVLDLIGLFFVGLLGALAVSGVGSQPPSERISAILNLFQINNLTIQSQVGVLGLIATFFFIVKTFSSILFTKRTLYFLSSRGASISALLVSRLLSKPLVAFQSHTTQQLTYLVTTGVSSIMIGMLATLVGVISDIVLLVIISVSLLIFSPMTAILCIVSFSVVGFLTYKNMGQKVQDLGRNESKLAIASNEKILEAILSYREAYVRNRRFYYASEIGKIRHLLSRTLAELAFVPYVSKYVIETTVILGALVIGAVEFLLFDAKSAIATLAIFLAAATRVAPAALRVQQGLLVAKNSAGVATPTFRFIEELDTAESLPESRLSLNLNHGGFEPSISVENVSLKYTSDSSFVLQDISFKIMSGEFVGIAGRSGSGKSTLVDCILGILPPTTGEIMISNVPPNEAITKWEGAISYVPQNAFLMNGTILENVTLGYPVDSIDYQQVSKALEIAQLKPLIEGLPLGIETIVGESGSMLSGGQRQRIAIARALYTNPKLLVLDEATSALDFETEVELSNALSAIRGQVTTLMIAHRISTVQNADTILYLENGRLTGVGSFEQLRKSVKAFETEAQEF